MRKYNKSNIHSFWSLTLMNAAIKILEIKRGVNIDGYV